MPYIKSEDRVRIRNGELPMTAGELNFKIFDYVKSCLECEYSPKESVIIKFVKEFIGNKPNYQRYNDMTGCLVRCQKEIQRRLGFEFKFLINLMESYDKEIADYEDVKIAENGDV